MASAAAPDGAWLHWRAEGSGEPLLMVMGLSGSSKAWYRLLPHASRAAECIVFDSRGTGAAAPAPRPLSMRDMVAVALAVLDAAAHETAPVMGVSMGGMV